MTHATQFLSSRKASSTAPVRDPARPSPYAPTEESLGSLQRAAPAPRPAFSLKVLDAVVEAQEARRLVAESAGVPGAVVEFVPRQSGARSFDVHVTIKSGTATTVSRRVEIFNVSERIRIAGDFDRGISHGASKIDPRAPPYRGATRESTVRVGWPSPDDPGFRIYDRDGRYYIPDARDPGSPVATGDLPTETLRKLNSPISPEVNQSARVNIIGQNGTLVFSFKNEPTGGSNWTLAFRRPIR